MKLSKRVLSAALAAGLALSLSVPMTTATAVVPSDNATTVRNLNVRDQNGDGVINVACLGDSITAGNTNYNWPMYLQEYLNYLGTQDGNTYVVHNHGKGGAACHYVEEEVGDPNWGWSTVIDEDGDNKAYFYYDDKAYRTAFEYVPDVVLIQFGTNDAFGSYKSYMKEDYYNHLIKPFADQGAEIVMATPTYACNGLHDGTVNGEMHDFEVAMAEEFGYTLIDLNRLLWGMKEVFADGLHGNVTGYSMMAMYYYQYAFGGDYIALNMKAEPGTRVSIRNLANNRDYARTTDENGDATLCFTPGSYEFRTIAECTGYKKVEQNVSMSDTITVTYEQEIGGFNVALNGTGIQCDSATYEGNHNADSLNDADRTGGGYQPNEWKEGDWCGIELGDVYAANQVIIYWETPSYISTYQDGGYDVYFMQAGEWNLMTGLSVTRASYSGDIVADTIALDPAMEIEGVKIVFLNGTIGDHKYAPKMYELEVLADDPNPVDPEPLTIGDVDANGTVEAADLTVLARHVAGIEKLTTAKTLKAADFDGNGTVEAADLTALARKVADIA